MSWRHVGASVVGTSHLRHGRPCQDAHDSVVMEQNGLSVFFAVVADGAGSAQHSDKGSAFACQKLRSLLRRWLRGRRAGHPMLPDEKRVHNWMRCIRIAMSKHAAVLGIQPRELACTLVCVIACDEGVTCFQVGDGAIVLQDREGKLSVPIWPDNGEYVNSTYFVTEPDANKHLHVVCQPNPPTGLALMSDGIQFLALQMKDKRAHAPFFQPMFAGLQKEAPGYAARLYHQLENFLTGPAVNACTDDDKTLIVAIYNSLQ